MAHAGAAVSRAGQAVHRRLRGLAALRGSTSPLGVRSARDNAKMTRMSIGQISSHLLLLVLSPGFIACASAGPAPGAGDSAASAIHDAASDPVAALSEQWLRCPPPNPRRPDLCTKACCGDGRNWYVSCITFVGEVGRAALGHLDPELAQGYSINPGVTYGSPMRAWEAMKKAGRARTDLGAIEPGSAVFYSIPTFAPGHVAIATGERDADGEPLVITTGGYRRKDLRKEKISEETRAVRARILGWAKIR